MTDIKLSILVLTLPSRIDYFYPRIMKRLIKQCEKSNRDDIELLALFDNKKRSVGEKRQNLIDIAQGDYLAFVDDDDRLDEDYLSEIINCIDNSPEVDCIVFDSICNINNGEKVLHCKYGIEYEYNINNTDTEWYGKPAHTMVWKSDIVRKFKYKHINNTEDADWVSRAWKDIKSQERINKILYYYDANYTTTSETAGLDDNTIKNNIEKIIEKQTKDN